MFFEEGGHPLAVGLPGGEVDGAVTRCARIGFKWREYRWVRNGGEEHRIGLKEL
jgi:hypothetical protein